MAAGVIVGLGENEVNNDPELFNTEQAIPLENLEDYNKDPDFTEFIKSRMSQLMYFSITLLLKYKFDKQLFCLVLCHRCMKTRHSFP